MTKETKPSSSWSDIGFKGYTNPHKPSENTLPPPVGIPSFRFVPPQASEQNLKPAQNTSSAQGNNSSK